MYTPRPDPSMLQEIPERGAQAQPRSANTQPHWCLPPPIMVRDSRPPYFNSNLPGQKKEKCRQRTLILQEEDVNYKRKVKPRA